MPKLKYKNNNEWTEINIVGEKGQNGLSAYEVAVDNGFIGTKQQWLESLRGASGQDGKNGTNGYSPTATVTKSGKATTITITDISGTTTAIVSDGQDGEDWIPTTAEKSAIATEAAGLIDISGKADKSDTYTKAEVDTKLSNKANSADVYTKTQSDGKYLTAHQDISGKADKATTLAGYGILDGETTLHKVTAITDDANDTQYPSAKAVYTAIQTAIGSIETQLSQV